MKLTLKKNLFFINSARENSVIHLFMITNTLSFWIPMHMHWGRGDRVRIDCSRQAPWVFRGLVPCSRVPWQCSEAVLPPAHLSKFGLQPGLELRTLHLSAQSPTDWATNTPYIARSTALQNLFVIPVRSTFNLLNADPTPLFQNCILLIWRVQRGKRKPKQRGIV